MKGLFGNLFDFNHDGKLDPIERAAEFDLFSQMMKDGDGDSGADDLNSNLDSDLDAELESDLEMAGLDEDELSMMDEDERREALEDAGLDPDDYE